MTIEQRIVEYLRSHASGASDAELRQALGLKYHQQANDRCRKLALAGIIERMTIDSTIVNRLVSADVPRSLQVLTAPPNEYHSEWFWEGNVQAHATVFLIQGDSRWVE